MQQAVEQIVLSLGAQLVEWRQNLSPDDMRWEGPQCKAAADFLAHDYLTERLGALTPDIAVLSEEAAWPTGARPSRYWLIDPIDGTASFVGGFPGYVTQVALMEGAHPVLACVYAPVTDELFSAMRGEGATRNGASIACDPASAAIIDNYPTPAPSVVGVMRRLGLSRYVESGSIGLKICRVADGTARLFFKDVVVRDWDIAPAALILGESGGVLTSLTGGEYPYEGEVEKIGIVATASRAGLDAFLASTPTGGPER